MQSIFTRVTKWREHQCSKHHSSDDTDCYVEKEVNSMSNYELLREISDAVDDMLSELD